MEINFKVGIGELSLLILSANHPLRKDELILF
jgi:hypothetical protein